MTQVESTEIIGVSPRRVRRLIKRVRGKGDISKKILTDAIRRGHFRNLNDII